MKILQLCTKVPYPPKDGGAIVIYQTASALIKQGHKVEILAVNPAKHFINTKISPNPENIPVHSVNINTSVSFRNAAINLLFKTLPYHVERFSTSVFEDKLNEVLTRFNPDIVQIEGVYLCEYIGLIRKISNAKIVLRQHNVEHIIWKEIAKHTPNIFHKIYLSILWRRLKKYEINAMEKSDGVIAISDLDQNGFKTLCPGIKLTSIPHCISTNPVNLTHHKSNTDFFYIGALDWLPNQSAIKWLVNNVWPLIVSEYPDLKLHIAGRNAPPELSQKLKNTKGVVFYGEIENQETFFLQHAVLLVPLFSGSGIRIKILEAMQYNCLVIATAKAIEGIDAKPGVHFLQADTEIDFFQKIKQVLNNKAIFEEITKNARELVQNNYNENNLALRLTNFYTLR
jgi:polysaccharide biosynthesis protein PslH